MGQFIKKVFNVSRGDHRKDSFNPQRRLKLDYVHQEPAGWPLTRPANTAEWSHVLRVMIMRRIPKHGPIHRTKLIRYVSADITAASAAKRLYVDSYFNQMRMTYAELKRMVKDQTIRTAPLMTDPEMYSSAPAIYRTENAERWLSLVPTTVKAVVDYLPVTNVLDMMVQALVDDD